MSATEQPLQWAELGATAVLAKSIRAQRSGGLSGFRSRGLTRLARFVLDECLPPVIRDSRLLMGLVSKLYCGPTFRHFDMDFKRWAVTAKDSEISERYRNAPGCGALRVRDTDLTPEEIAWILTRLEGESVLEIGAGEGVLAALVARAGHRVTATEITPEALAGIRGRAAHCDVEVETRSANAERLPFADDSFDTVVAAHTLEHVRRFERAVSEMARVARRRVIIVVPKQRYYRYTVDYHLHFFPEPEQLILRADLPDCECEVVTGDLCYVAMLHGAR